KSMRSYGDESQIALESLIYDAITTAMTSSVAPITQTELSTYDAVLIVHAGAGEEADVNSDSTFDIWSLYYYNPDGIAQNGTPIYDTNNLCTNCLKATLKDGSNIKEAILMPQTDSQDGVVVDPLGVYVHEFGHWLGLPDLYCTALICPLDGVGEWSLMGDGIYNRVGTNPYGSSPAHLDAWSKVYLGWVTPTNPQTDPELAQSFALAPIVNNQQMFKIPAVSSDPAAAQQYYLLENRQQSGFDASIPGHGLLVWLVDEWVIAAKYASNTINNSVDHPGVKLIEADGDYALLKYGCTSSQGIDCGSPSDAFPGTDNVTRLTPVSSPSSTAYSPDLWVNLRNIMEDPVTRDISLDIGFAPHPPQNVVVDGGGNVTWSPYSVVQEADGATTYNIYRNGVLMTAVPLAAKKFTDPAPVAGGVYRVTGLDAAGNESTFSNDSTLPAVTSKSGPCFIATAAYGSYLDPHVKVLRDFRDRSLLTNGPGRAFVTLYYRYSPPIADFIGRHESLRLAARVMIAPVVFSIEYPLPAVSCMCVAVCFIFLRLGREKSIYR
ncbi:MAG: immune inhibitor A, partial [Nitrospirota bacterium]|nr:immune inhibitor A [Nitrospirota bacterium]